MNKHKKSLFIFRRDLRIEDNSALNIALENSDKVVLAFIFTPVQIEKNEYFSNNFMNFMVNSLKGIEAPVHFFYGDNVEVIEELIEKNGIDGIYLNKDYTPFSIKRDEEIEKLCFKKEISFTSVEDYLINPVDEIMRKSYYKVFTPYYNEAKLREVRKPRTVSGNFEEKVSSSYFCKLDKFYNENPYLAVKGGRKEALSLINKNLSDYSFIRNFPSISTSKLSAHLKLGTVSVREAMYKLRENKCDEELIRQIYWRDFWAYITYNQPKVIKENFYEKFDPISWDSKDIEAWKNGETGFPIVDAGMRELKKTGWMHNRVRMLTASFLVKNLFVDWRVGAKYFSQTLVDYCPMQNQNNWQSVAGTGASALAWFRVMNPWLQQKKYDEDCKYILKWIPELKGVPIKSIHNWFEDYVDYNVYFKPIVDHKGSAAKFINSFKALK